MSEQESTVDVFIIGTGMVGYRQLTREAEAALAKSDKVYLVHGQKSVEEYIRDEHSVDVIDLIEEYTPQEERSATYNRMAKRVLAGAEKTSGTICFALYGHPMVYVSPARIVAEQGAERGLNIEILPGISSMDCLYTDIHLDPASNGIQMFEATDLLLREFDLNPDVPVMIWQIGTVETVLYTQADSKPGRFTNIRNYLERFYPSDHIVSLLKTATYPITESERIDFELHKFEEMHNQIDPVHTLYIPPVNDKTVENSQLASQVQSREHLNDITETE